MQSDTILGPYEKTTTVHLIFRDLIRLINHYINLYIDITQKKPLLFSSYFLLL